MQLSLRYKFLLPTIAIIILGTSILTFASYYKSSEAIRKLTESQLELSLQAAVKDFETSLDDLKLLIQEWKEDKTYMSAAQYDSEDYQTKAACGKLKKTFDQFPYFVSINVANPKGMVVSSSNPGAPFKWDISDRPYFKDALKGNPNVSEVVIDKTTGMPVAMISAPLVDNDKNIVGVLSAVLNMNVYCNKYIASIKIGEKGYASAYSPEGILFFDPDASRVLKFNLNQSDYGRDMLANGHGIITFKDDGEERIAAYGLVKGLNMTVSVSAALQELLSPIRMIRSMNIAFSILVVLLATGVVFLIARSIARSIGRASENLNEAAQQVSAASGQIAANSQELANGASEQAASIEETSSSLEEMSSMTRQNAENALQADRLMSGTKDTVALATHSMEELTVSIEEISRASEETSKIIRTIDEIAFQTNLLALNAAVEAARAGEAGAGFAVVADEVRNLAMRAADAARNTDGLIKGTVQKIREGSALVERTGLKFHEVAEGVEKTGALVGEISAASQEQAHGIELVNKAVGNMDKVVQQNAANAEESASASNEMNAQAERMKVFLDGLTTIVTGRNGFHTTKEDGSKKAGKTKARIAPGAADNMQKRIENSEF